MRNISTAEAFLIFAKWRDECSQIQLSIFEPNGKSHGTPFSISAVSEKDEEIAGEIVQSEEKRKCALRLRGSIFAYGEPSEDAVFPEFAEGKWASYIDAECPNGVRFVFAERSKA